MVESRPASGAVRVDALSGLLSTGRASSEASDSCPGADDGDASAAVVIEVSTTEYGSSVALPAK